MEEKSEIRIISNKYKDTLNCLNTKSSDWIDFIDWSDSLEWLDSSNWPGLNDKGSYNTSRFWGDLLTLFKRDCLDDNISIILLKLVSYIWNS